MPTVVDMIENLSAFDLKREVQALFVQNEKHIITLNQAQMLKGKKRNNEGIGEYLSDNYAAYKFSFISSEAGEGNVDLKLSGDFYKGLEMKLSGENIDIKSSDFKSSKLESKYGSDIFGLTSKNWQIFSTEVLMPDFFLAMNKKTGLRP